MLGAKLEKLPVVALHTHVTATVAEQTKCYISRSLRMVDPEIIALNPNTQNIFYTGST